MSIFSRKPWHIVIVGRESQKRTPMGFVKFATKEEAEKWVSQQTVMTDLIRYEVEKR